VGYGFGSLACGSDILVAEALLARGAGLHVVLPFDTGEFLETSVRRGGAGWPERFRRCLDAARAVSRVTSGGHGGDDRLFRQAARLAMGLSLLEARARSAGVLQLAIWDGQPASGLAGTAVDVAGWASRGLPCEVIDPGSAADGTRAVAGAPVAEVTGPAGPGRALLCVVAAEVPGQAPLREVVAHHGDAVAAVELQGPSWLLAFHDAAAAARCALELQQRSVRVGAHLGLAELAPLAGEAVTRVLDLLSGTPPGHAYVSAALAAELVLSGTPHTCQAAAPGVYRLGS
jgi:adenylate cyclase